MDKLEVGNEVAALRESLMSHSEDALKVVV